MVTNNVSFGVVGAGVSVATASSTLFQCAVGFLDVVEPEQPSDGNVELTGRGEIGRLCEHARIGGVKVASGATHQGQDRAAPVNAS